MARILLVEDDRDVRRAILRTFMRQHEFVEAADGETGLRHAQSQPFDIALVDYQLGAGMDGLELLAHLKEVQPHCARLLMTGDPDYDVLKRALNGGAVLRLVTKPFGVTVVEEAVQKALEFVRSTPAGRQSVARACFLECVENDLLRLAVQPIVECAAPHRPVAFECLLRSRHHALAGPKEVLDMVTAAGEIPALGGVVNRLAAQWIPALPSDAYIFVNVHAEQFSDPDLVERFAPLIPHSGRVVLEITETIDLEAVKNWDAGIASLAAVGFRYAVDDVGAGFNGLKLLAMLSPTFIKVDMSIVRNVHKEPRKQRLVELLGKFASADNSRVIAEGVESADEAAALAVCGAHLLQGFYFARPTLHWPARP